MGAITRDIAQIFLRLNLDSMLAWTLTGHEIALGTQNEGLQANSFHRLGVAYYTKGEYPLSLEAFNEAIRLCRRIDREERLHFAEFEMAQVYREMGDYENARKYIDRFYQYYRQREDGRRLVIALSSYSTLFEKLEMTDSVLFYSEKALQVAIAYEETDYINILYTNLAAAYFYNQRYEQALATSQKAREFALEQQDLASLYYSHFTTASTYEALGQIDSSLQHFQLALEAIQEYGELKEEAETTEKIALQYEKLGDFRQAFSFLKRAKGLHDSLLSKKYDRQASELKIQYETQQTQTELAQQALLLEKERSRQNVLLFAGITTLLIVLIVLIVLRNRQKTTEQALQNQRLEARKLKELNQLKSDFFTNISHELRTPLSLILAPLRDMQQESFQGDEQAYLEMMSRNGERLLTLVNQLLDLSQLELGQMQLNNKIADITAYLHGLVATFSGLAHNQQVKLVSSLENEAVLVAFDADKLEKIITNLLLNAIKFTPAGGTVEFACETQPSEQTVQLHLRIADTGPGIPAEEMPYIFQRFYSRPHGEGQKDGIGIGLALAKELVELFGGEIKVESKLGEGSTFFLRLDFERAVAETSSPPMASLDEGTMLSRSATKEAPDLVMVVEDHADMRKYLVDKLRGAYRVLEASDGKEAVSLAHQHIPDLIISDWMLPGLAGDELVRELKNSLATSHIPIIMLTAKSAQEDRLTGLSAGVEAYLTKPFDAQELMLRVENILAQRKQLQEKFTRQTRAGNISLTIDELGSQDEHFLKKLITIIETNLANDSFSIPDMSREIGISRSQLARKLKALTGQTPSGFLKLIRLQHAHQLLSQNAGNISEIALKVGMPNLSYFSRSFREKYGYPPSEVRNR
jgi:signal transduction histidine kinase/AraC-like DNA-binding protein